MACVGTLWKMKCQCCFFVSPFLILHIDLVTMISIYITRKGTECHWSLWGHMKQFTRKMAKQTKLLIYSLCLCPSICWLSNDKNVLAVTLLFILLMSSFTLESFLSLCQPPTPPHFVQTMWSSQQKTKAYFVKILSVSLWNGYLNVFIFGD